MAAHILRWCKIPGRTLGPVRAALRSFPYYTSWTETCIYSRRHATSTFVAHSPCHVIRNALQSMLLRKRFSTGHANIVLAFTSELMGHSEGVRSRSTPDACLRLPM